MQNLLVVLIMRSNCLLVNSVEMSVLYWLLWRQEEDGSGAEGPCFTCGGQEALNRVRPTFLPDQQLPYFANKWFCSSLLPPFVPFASTTNV